MNNDQVHRQTLLWLVIALLISLLPHAVHLSSWVWPLVGVCIIWRSLIHKEKIGFPPIWIKVLLVAGGFASLQSTFMHGAVMDGSAALLSIAACLKLLEMRTRRDVYVLLFLYLFLLQSSFLYDRSILAAIIAIIGVGVIVVAMISLNVGTLNSHNHRSAMSLSGIILLQSLPIMLVLFLFFPRLGPLWSVGSDTGGAKIGLSSSMSPGNLSDLSASDELAFRVTFSGEKPRYENLYWRAMVFDDFDGKTWKQSENINYQPNVFRENISDINQITGRFDYEIIQEATDQPWLFTLDTLESHIRGTTLTNRYTLIKDSPVFQRYRYKVVSDVTKKRDESGLPYSIGQASLAVADGNYKMKALATRLKQQYITAEDRVNAGLRYYRENPFYYTLKPPLLDSNDRIDEFLFSSKQGYCSHFASSFTQLMRAMGIPARVVVGYMGGEYNPDGNYYSIYQFDAHAWSEVWLPSKGWVSVDPTAQVAPDRVLYGLEQALEDGFLESSTLSLMKVRGITWINDLRLKMQSINYYWYRFVLSYDNEQRKGLLENLSAFFKNNLILVLSLMAGVIAIIISIAFLFVRSQSKITAIDQRFMTLQKILYKSGVPINPTLGPSDYIDGAIKTSPHLKSLLLQFKSLYIQLQYAEVNDVKSKELQHKIGRLSSLIKKMIRQHKGI